jgi:cytochrome c biogenesis protein CcmG/thiol:disulfide interchange protein DsbE
MPAKTRTPRAFALALFFCAMFHFGAAQAAKAPATAPPIHLPGRTGQVDSDSLHAKLMVVDFWASWCVPCRHSFPFFARLDSIYGSKGLVIVAVNLDKTREAADGFLAKYPASFRVAFDASGETAEAYHVKGMPTTYLVGEDGRVISSHVGFDDKSAAALEAQIARALTP